MIIDSRQHPMPEVPQIMAEHGIDVGVLLPVGPGAFDMGPGAHPVRMRRPVAQGHPGLDLAR